MLTLEGFIKEAIKNGVCNDESKVWVEVWSDQYITEIENVISHENYPYEASSVLESETNNPAWELLYDDYVTHIMMD